MRYQVDEKGFYGDFGGAYIPEMLYPNIEELRKSYIEISEDGEFQKEFKSLLKEYVGRPTPLYFAERLSDKYNTKIILEFSHHIKTNENDRAEYSKTNDHCKKNCREPGNSLRT